MHAASWQEVPVFAAGCNPCLQVCPHDGLPTLLQLDATVFEFFAALTAFETVLVDKPKNAEAVTAMDKQ